MAKQKALNELALGYTLAVLSAAAMLLFSLLGGLSMYPGAVMQMQQWHMFYSLSLAGTIAGMIEAAVWGFIAGYVFGWLYNKFA